MIDRIKRLVWLRSRSPARWLARELSGSMDAAEREALQDWLDQAPGRRHTYARLREMWTSAQHLKDHPANQAERRATREAVPLRRSGRPARDRDQTSARWPWVATGALAAALVAVVLTRDPAVIPARVTTAEPQVRLLILDDGSTVTLGDDTRLTASFSPSRRRVMLEHGTARFDVVGDPARPFDVVGANSVVTALGTSFAVHVEAGATSVTLYEGVVEVQPTTTAEGHGTGAAPPPWRETLKPGQRLKVASKAGGPAVARSDTVESPPPAPRVQRIEFNGTPLAVAAEKFSQHAGVRVYLADDADLAALQISGSFKPDDWMSFLEALEQRFAIKADALGDNEFELSASASPDSVP